MQNTETRAQGRDGRGLRRNEHTHIHDCRYSTRRKEQLSLHQIFHLHALRLTVHINTRAYTCTCTHTHTHCTLHTLTSSKVFGSGWEEGKGGVVSRLLRPLLVVPEDCRCTLGGLEDTETEMLFGAGSAFLGAAVTFNAVD